MAAARSQRACTMHVWSHALALPLRTAPSATTLSLQTAIARSWSKPARAEAERARLHAMRRAATGAFPRREGKGDREQLQPRDLLIAAQ